jgi:hypothetical protein
MAERDEHLKPLRLFDLARDYGWQITDEERKHLQQCEQCRSIHEVFARQFAKPLSKKPEDAA